MKIIGIDLGTTNSAVSVYEKGTTRTLMIKGSLTTPSVIWVNNDGDFVVGKEAKQRIATEPDRVLVSTKRDMGSDKTYVIDGEVFTPTDAATLILRYLKVEAGKALGDEVNDAVITVPAYFGLQERGEVKKAAIDAGLNPIAIIPEPTAAAIKYGVATTARQLICVIDLGGGTFDVSVLKSEYDRVANRHSIDCLSFDGDHYLGGDDFDNAIIEYMIANGAQGFHNKLELKDLAEAAKIELCQMDEAEIQHPKYMPESLILTRNKYKHLIDKYLSQINDTIVNTVQSTVIDGEHLDMSDINRFVLVGGSCKHVLVFESIKKLIGKNPYTSPNLDTYVADGAAIYHHEMTLPDGIRTGVTLPIPKTLGTDAATTEGVINAQLLAKGTKLPCRAVSLFYVREGQPELKSRVIEGDGHLMEDPENKILQEISMDLKFRDCQHPLVTEFIVDASGVLSFLSIEVKYSSSTADDIEELVNSVQGSANLIPEGMWDDFKAKHPEALNEKPIKLSIFDKPSK